MSYLWEGKEREEDQKFPALFLDDSDPPELTEAIRMVCDYGGVEKEAVHKGRGGARTGTVLHVDSDTSIFEPRAILRYVGRVTKTYPSRNPLDAALVDEWVVIYSDMASHLFQTSSLTLSLPFLTEEQEEEHERWVMNVVLPYYLSMLEDNLKKTETGWIAGMLLPSIADFCWQPTLKWIDEGEIYEECEGMLEDYPLLKDLVSRLDEEVKGAIQRMESCEKEKED